MVWWNEDVSARRDAEKLKSTTVSPAGNERESSVCQCYYCFQWTQSCSKGLGVRTLWYRNVSQTLISLSLSCNIHWHDFQSCQWLQSFYFLVIPVLSLSSPFNISHFSIIYQASLPVSVLLLLLLLLLFSSYNLLGLLVFPSPQYIQP